MRLTSKNGLSPREREILTRLGRGERIKDIAAALQVRAGTVGTFRRRLLDKLGLKTNADLVLLVDREIRRQKSKRAPQARD